MVRIYCLSSIIKSNEELSTKSEDPSMDCNNFNEDFFYRENNTKIVIQKILDNPNAFIAYQLTEICIGYHYLFEKNGNKNETGKKVFLLLIYRKDTGLIVIKMMPGSVDFQSITNQICEFKIATSYHFNLLVKVRCIKNTKVRNISADEIIYYENYAKTIENYSKNEEGLLKTAFEMFDFKLPNESVPNVLRTKLSDINTAIKLLCDPETGNAENVQKHLRLNQKAKCLWITQPVKNIERSSAKVVCDDEKGDSLKSIQRVEEVVEKERIYRIPESILHDDIEIFHTSSKIPPQEHERCEKIIKSNNTVMEQTSNILQNNETSKYKKRGRPKFYETEKERKQARSEASKKYNVKKYYEYEKLKREVILLEKMIDDVKLQTLMNKLSEGQRNHIQNMLKNINEDNAPKESSNITNRKGGSEISYEKHDSLNNKTDGSKNLLRREKQRLAVQRARRQKMEEIRALEERKHFYQQKIKALQKLYSYMEHILKNAASAKNSSFNTDISEQMNFSNKEYGIDKVGKLTQQHSETIPPINDIQENFNLTNQKESTIEINNEALTFPTTSDYKCGDKTNPCKLVQLLLKTIEDWKDEEIDVTNFHLRKRHKSRIDEHPKVSNYASLTRLKLQHCEISEICDCFFQALPAYLTFIDLSYNNITKISPSISRLINLKILYLIENNNLTIDGIPWESLPPTLKTLKFEKNSLQKIPDHLSNLPNLSWLKINCNKIQIISDAILKFQTLNFLELENNFISTLPEGFENLTSLEYLNLSNNCFHHEKENLDETLWRRLPSNIAVLILNKNYLLQLPCSLKALTKLRLLAVNSCNLEKICPFFAGSISKEKECVILDIQNNPRIKALPFIPKIFYKESPKKYYHNSDVNFELSKLNLITDNEEFNVRTFELIPLYEFKVLDDEDNNYCKCCSECGKETDEKMCESLMIMDFNLCVVGKQRNSKYADDLEEFENCNIEKLFNNRYKSIRNYMKQLGCPGKWKAKVKIRMCSECYRGFQNKIKCAIYEDLEENGNDNSSSSHGIEKCRLMYSYFTEDEYLSPHFHPTHYYPSAISQHTFQQSSFDTNFYNINEPFEHLPQSMSHDTYGLKHPAIAHPFEYQQQLNEHSTSAYYPDQIKQENIDSEFSSNFPYMPLQPSLESNVEYEYLYHQNSNNVEQQLHDHMDQL